MENTAEQDCQEMVEYIPSSKSTVESYEELVKVLNMTRSSRTNEQLKSEIVKAWNRNGRLSNNREWIKNLVIRLENYWFKKTRKDRLGLKIMKM
jgi:hypothetical protein